MTENEKFGGIEKNTGSERHLNFLDGVGWKTRGLKDVIF